MTGASAVRAKSRPVIVVMGVAGSGKSFVGRALAERCGALFIEGDDLHPPENIERMTQGAPLDDEARDVWLARVGSAIAAVPEDRPAVVACSALKRRYRDRLRAASPRVAFIFLDVSRELARRRMSQRSGHFMPASLLDSQFEALEVPTRDEPVLTLDGALSADDLLMQVCGEFDLGCASTSPE